MKRTQAAAADAVPPAVANEIRPGQSVALLQQLHILTRDGKLNQDSRRKLKQVYHLFQFIEKLLLELPATGSGPTLADHGAGKSYLGFIIYDLFFKALGQGTIYGIETRSELVASSQALAERLGFERMRFLNVSVAESTQSSELPAQIDVVTPSPSACKRKPNTWCWCPAARPSWPGRSTRTRRSICSARPWLSCGVTPCTPAKWAVN
jgi:Methyltransferase domain